MASLRKHYGTTPCRQAQSFVHRLWHSYVVCVSYASVFVVIGVSISLLTIFTANGADCICLVTGEHNRVHFLVCSSCWSCTCHDERRCQPDVSVTVHGTHSKSGFGTYLKSKFSTYLKSDFSSVGCEAADASAHMSVRATVSSSIKRQWAVSGNRYQFFLSH